MLVLLLFRICESMVDRFDHLFWEDFGMQEEVGVVDEVLGMILSGLLYFLKLSMRSSKFGYGSCLVQNPIEHGHSDRG